MGNHSNQIQRNIEAIFAANSNNSFPPRKAYLIEREDGPYVVVLMKQRSPVIYNGSYGGMWTPEILAMNEAWMSGSFWIELDIIPQWVVDAIAQKSSPSEFSEEEIQKALEIINGQD